MHGSCNLLFSWKNSYITRLKGMNCRGFFPCLPKHKTWSLERARAACSSQKHDCHWKNLCIGRAVWPERLEELAGNVEGPSSLESAPCIPLLRIALCTLLRFIHHEPYGFLRPCQRHGGIIWKLAGQKQASHRAFAATHFCTMALWVALLCWRRSIR